MKNSTQKNLSSNKITFHKRLSINHLFLFCLFFLIIVPLFFSFLWVYNANSKEHIRKQDEAIYQSLSGKRNDIVYLLNEMDDICVEMVSNSNYQNVVKYYLENDVLGYEQEKHKLSMYLNNSLPKVSYFSGLYISSDGEIIYQYANESILYESIPEYATISNESHLPMYCLTIPDKEQFSNNPSPSTQISVVRNTKDYRYGKTIIYRYSIDEAYFRNYYKTDIYDNTNAYVVDENNLIVSSTKPEYVGSTLKNQEIINLVSDANFHFARIEIENYPFLVLNYEVPEANWNLVYSIPVAEIDTESQMLISFTILALIICLIFGFLFYRILNSSVIRPIDKLTQKMIRYGNDDEISEKYNFDKNEIDMLEHSFKEMTIRIEDLIESVYNSKIKEKEAQLMALESQINPHFLYNTLDSIRWKAIMNKDYEVGTQIEVLSNIFRHVLNKGDEMTTIGDELNHINNYIYIQKIRTGKKIDFHINCDEDVKKCNIPKLILQVLVENSIIHGHQQKLNNGNVWIDICKTLDNKISLTVKDDGIGADDNIVNSILDGTNPKATNIALKNSSERIKIKYGQEYGINFKSKKGNGTIVTILIPFEYIEVVDDE